MRTGTCLLIAMTLPGAFGAEVTRTPAVSGFTRVEAHNAFEVDIQRGEAYRVEIRADASIADKVEARTAGDRLILELKGNDWGRPWGERNRVHIQVTMPLLRSYAGSGATVARISGFRSANPVEVDLSGSSRLEASFDAGDTDIELSGSSRVDFAGRGGALRVSASGSSRVDLEDFVASSAALSLSGASRVAVNTTGRLDVRSSGSSRVTYTGHPQMGRIDSSGSSSIRARD